MKVKIGVGVKKNNGKLRRTLNAAKKLAVGLGTTGLMVLGCDGDVKNEFPELRSPVETSSTLNSPVDNPFVGEVEVSSSRGIFCEGTMNELRSGHVYEREQRLTVGGYEIGMGVSYHPQDSPYFLIFCQSNGEYLGSAIPRKGRRDTLCIPTDDGNFDRISMASTRSNQYSARISVKVTTNLGRDCSKDTRTEVESCGMPTTSESSVAPLVRRFEQAVRAMLRRATLRGEEICSYRDFELHVNVDSQGRLSWVGYSHDGGLPVPSRWSPRIRVNDLQLMAPHRECRLTLTLRLRE